MHLHIVHMAYSECLPTLLNPLAERTCFSQAAMILAALGWRTIRETITAREVRSLSDHTSLPVFIWWVCMGGCMGERIK